MIITDDQAKEICKVGQGRECCIYLTMGNGWICGKSDKMIKDQLTKRLLAGTTNAKGIGEVDNCPFKLLNKEE